MATVRIRKWPHLVFGLLVWGLLVQELACGGFGRPRHSLKNPKTNSRKSPTSIKDSDEQDSKEAEISTKDQYETAWQNFKKEYSPHNPSKISDTYKKYFVRNYGLIMNHTKLAWIHNYKLKINRFGTTDFSKSKGKGCLDESTLFTSENFCQTKTLKWTHHLPKTVDWRKKYLWHVVKVSNQGPCSSCWAFSAVAVLEGWFARKNVYKEFSPQQLLDCTKDAKDSCKKGGTVPKAFEILHNLNGNIATIQSYPYHGDSDQQKKTRSCPMKEDKPIPDRYSTHIFTGKCARVNVKSLNDKEEQLKAAVANYGPVSVSVFAEIPTFMFYSSGIYDDKKCKRDVQPTHAVTVVGYSTEGTKNYWIIKNSWGSNWGENGFMKMAMGDNLCGIANYAYFIMDSKDNNDTENKDKIHSPMCTDRSDVACGSFSPPTAPRANANQSAMITCLIVLYFITWLLLHQPFPLS